ncbi:hypothetical protein C1Y40_05171 [Mycobacterium talmoniae]|uniref:Uncharacterized protein n=1 Tax=Mycobacterium talmoniae TaxID=1858794 RepID=A0A2S8BDG6_9MYCO|nr:hypothetical protein C1Y40_05171 [Mycobacterium talmoniae]
MTLNYGRPANPEAFVIGVLMPLGLPVRTERDEDMGLPCYTVTAVNPKHNKFMLWATVSVHSYGQGNTPQEGRAIASDAAWNADNALISVTPGDVITMADGRTASAWINCEMAPTFADYQDPFIKRYVGRYNAELRFNPTH